MNKNKQNITKTHKKQHQLLALMQMLAYCFFVLLIGSFPSFDSLLHCEDVHASSTLTHKGNSVIVPRRMNRKTGTPWQNARLYIHSQPELKLSQVVYVLFPLSKIILCKILRIKAFHFCYRLCTYVCILLLCE